MEGVTEELREQSEKGQDETGSASVNDTLPIGMDDPSIVTGMDPGEEETEPPPDWLEPLEDCEDEGDEGVEIDRSTERRRRRGNNASYVLLYFLNVKKYSVLHTLNMLMILK